MTDYSNEVPDHFPAPLMAPQVGAVVYINSGSLLPMTYLGDDPDQPGMSLFVYEGDSGLEYATLPLTCVDVTR